MNNFIYHNPTKLVFGKGQIARLPKLIPAGKRIMLTFGGGSVKRNGVYDQVVAALEGRDLVEFWGIEANPSVETLREAIALGKERKVDFLLAVGGGSVIDGTKLIAAGLLYDGDAWDIVLKGQAGKTVPLATVLTMSATGSEMNSGAVISRYETKEKYAFYGDYPVFSILDPETLYSLPKRQVACGLADTFVHVLEQYMTTPHQSRLMDRWAEGILHTVVEIAPKALADERDYDTMSEYMLSATLALNDMIRMGDAGLGDAHDRPRADGAARLDARRDAGHCHQRYAARAARAETRQTAAIRRAYLGHCRRFGGGAHRPYDCGQRGVLPFAGPLDTPFGGGYRRRDHRRDRTPLHGCGRSVRRGAERRRRHGPPDSGGLPVIPLPAAERTIPATEVAGIVCHGTRVYSSTPNVETLRLPSASTVMPYSPVSTPFRMMR